jgi:hypothetical protein
MRTLVAALVAVTFIAGIAGPTYATSGNGGVAKQKVDRLNSQGHN